jgi:hypothetical protein
LHGYDPPTSRAGRVDYSVHIIGKAGHERTVPISDELVAERLAIATVHVFPVFGGARSPRQRVDVQVVDERLLGQVFVNRRIQRAGCTVGRFVPTASFTKPKPHRPAPTRYTWR